MWAKTKPIPMRPDTATSTFLPMVVRYRGGVTVVAKFNPSVLGGGTLKDDCAFVPVLSLCRLRPQCQLEGQRAGRRRHDELEGPYPHAGVGGDLAFEPPFVLASRPRELGVDSGRIHWS